MQQKKIKIVCISDTHSRHEQLGILKGDILIHAGDFSFYGQEQEIKNFANWIDQQQFKHKIVIAGNHDMTLDENLKDNENKDLEQCKLLKNILRQCCIYLEHEFVIIENIKIFGSPYTTDLEGMGFQYKRGKEGLALWQQVPNDIDILITHGPPYDIFDKVKFGGNKVGCQELGNEIKNRIKPKYHIFGHIHEQYGKVQKNKTIYLNVSQCDIEYKLNKSPVEIQFE